MTDQAAPPTSDSPPKTREELYRMIRESSKDEVILDGMIRHGFWPSDQEQPGLETVAIRRKGELVREMSALRTELSRLQNAEAMRKAIRKRRMQDSKKKQVETKLRREKERLERAEQWMLEKSRDILYLGEEVSPASLREKTSDPGRLAQHGLPQFNTVADIAKKMEITVGELRFLSFTRRVSKTTHYKRFSIAKKSGGERFISAPMPRLKEAQHWVLENILNPVPLHESAHGFRGGRSIVGNASPHTGRDVVVNLDLKDFFPTVTYPRVKGLFRSLGYSEQIAVIFALLCTEPDVDRVEIDGASYYVAKSARFLPQGAPSSPAITNILCRRLDRRLSGLGEALGFVYSRYADDITFSAAETSSKSIGKLLRKTSSIVEHEGFHVHPGKTRVLHKGARQEVTGLVVNKGLSVDRKTLRRLRATLFQLEMDGLEGKHWKNANDIIASIEGYAYFVSMVDKEKGAALLERIKGIKARIAYKKPRHKRFSKKTPSWKLKPPTVAVEEAPAPLDLETRAPREAVPEPASSPSVKKPWWKFW